MFCYSQSKAVS